MLAPKQPTNVLKSLLTDTKFTDVALFGVLPPTTHQQDGETVQPVRAHKSVLAAASKFFDQLFSSEFADSRKDEYTLANVKHEVLKLVVEALYTGKVLDKRVFTEVEVACDMLESFKYLLLDELALACENLLIKHHITVEKCILVWKIACKYTDLPKLTIKVEKFMALWLPELMSEQNLLGLTSDEICRMMLTKSIKVSTSADVRFQAAFTWLDHNSSARRAFSDDILAVIPLTPGKISRESLTKACYSRALTETAAVKIFDLLACSLNVADVDFAVEPDFITRASPMSGGSLQQNRLSVIFCVGGQMVEHENDCLKYEVDSKIWQHLKPLPWKRFGGGSCVIGDRLMLFGGNVSGEQSASVVEYKLSSEDSSWEVQQPANYGISGWTSCVACGVGDVAYVCGGIKKFLEYAPPTNVWKEKSCMITSDRCGSSIVYSQTSDAVYVAGGVYCDKTVCERETQIDKFDVKNNSWATVGFAKHVRFDLGTALCGDILYLIGGQTTGKSVETFNIRTGNAYKVPDLLHERESCHAALLYNNVICVFGGNQKSVEAFDVREGKWTTGVVVPDMPFENSMFSFAYK